MDYSLWFVSEFMLQLWDQNLNVTVFLLDDVIVK